MSISSIVSAGEQVVRFDGGSPPGRPVSLTLAVTISPTLAGHCEQRPCHCSQVSEARRIAEADRFRHSSPDGRHQWKIVRQLEQVGNRQGKSNIAVKRDILLLAAARLSTPLARRSVLIEEDHGDTSASSMDLRFTWWPSVRASGQRSSRRSHRIDERNVARLLQSSSLWRKDIERLKKKVQIILQALVSVVRAGRASRLHIGSLLLATLRGAPPVDHRSSNQLRSLAGASNNSLRAFDARRVDGYSPFVSFDPSADRVPDPLYSGGHVDGPETRSWLRRHRGLAAWQSPTCAWTTTLRQKTQTARPIDASAPAMLV